MLEHFDPFPCAISIHFQGFQSLKVICNGEHGISLKCSITSHSEKWFWFLMAQNVRHMRWFIMVNLSPLGLSWSLSPCRSMGGWRTAGGFPPCDDQRSWAGIRPLKQPRGDGRKPHLSSGAGSPRSEVSPQKWGRSSWSHSRVRKNGTPMMADGRSSWTTTSHGQWLNGHNHSSFHYRVVSLSHSSPIESPKRWTSPGTRPKVTWDAFTRGRWLHCEATGWLRMLDDGQRLLIC